MTDLSEDPSETSTPSESRTFRTAVVGCGEIAQTHVQYLKEMPQVDVVAVCDLAKDRAEDLARTFQIAGCFTDLDEMMNQVHPDVVHVLTPPRVTPSLAVKILEGGAHVLVEKPMARSSAEARQMIEAAAKGGVRLGVDHSRLLHPSVLAARERLEAGDLGDLISVEITQGYNPAAVPPGHWFHSYPWGILEDLIPHGLYLCRLFSGDPSDMVVQASNSDRARPAPFDDLRILWRGSRATGQIMLSLAAAPERSTVTLRGTRATMVLDTNHVTEVMHRDLPLPWVVRKGAVNLDLAWQFSLATFRNVLRTVRGELRSYPDIRATLQAFYSALADGSALPAGHEDGLRIVELMEDVRHQIEIQTAPKTASGSADVTETTMPAAGSKRMFLVGGTGLVGRAVLREAAAAGYQVTVLIRPASEPPTDLPPGATLWRGDLSSRERLQEALAGHDVVVNAAGVLSSPHGPRVYQEGNIDGPCRLVRAAAAAGAGYMVHLSSAGIYGLPAEVIVDEDSPLEPFPERRGLYTATKLEGEKQVIQAATECGLTLGVLRPTLIYGPGLDLPLGLFQVGTSRQALLIGDPSTPMGLTHATNVADAVLTCAESGKAGIWNVIDDEDLTIGSWIELRNRLRGDNLQVAYLPLEVALAVAFVASPVPKLSTVRYRLHRTCAPFRLTAGRLRDELGWSPRVSPAQSLATADLSGEPAAAADPAGSSTQ